MDLSLPQTVIIASPSEDLKEVTDGSAATQKRKTPEEGPHGETKKRKANINSDLIKLLVSSGCEYLVRYAHNNIDGIVYPERLDGKAVVLICMWLPISTDALATYFRNLKETYLAFCKEHNNIVEFVMAPLMDNPERDDSEEDFREFASSLPFLTIPYINRDARLSVAKHAELSTDSYNDNNFAIIAFDRDGKEAADIPSYNLYCLLQHYSTDCYPFTKGHLDSLWVDRHKFKTIEGPFSLQSLFCCPSDTIDLGLTKLDGTPVSHTVSTLRKTHNGIVGFYLCVEGDFLEELIKVHQLCKSDGNNFVIVLLYIPYLRPVDEDLNSFLNRINNKLSSLNINDEDWFVLPFKDPRSDKVCRRFWHLYPSYNFDCDMLAMLGPNGEFDPDAREMICHYGPKAFPLTKYRVKEDLLSGIESLTLEDFVLSATITRPGPYSDRREVVSLSKAVENKETILILHCYERNPESMDDYFKLLHSWYEAIKHSESASHFEVIVVCLLDSRFDAFVSKLPWLVARCNLNDAATTCNKIKKLGHYNVGGIVAFHKGKVILLHAEDSLIESPTGFLTHAEDLLESEVSEMLDDFHSDMVQSFDDV